jgi:hypothetical protein
MNATPLIHTSIRHMASNSAAHAVWRMAQRLRMRGAVLVLVLWSSTAAFGQQPAEGASSSPEGEAQVGEQLALSLPARAAILCPGLQGLVVADPLELRGDFVGYTALGSSSYKADVSLPDIGNARLYLRPSVQESYTLEAILEQPVNEAEGRMLHDQWTQVLHTCLDRSHRMGTDEHHTTSVERTPFWPKHEGDGAVLNLSLEKDWSERYWLKLVLVYL